MYKKRSLERYFKKRLKDYPITVVLGARQVGKSTLVKKCLPQFRYFDLENPQDYSALKAATEQIFEQYSKIIIDEAQRWPELFSFLRYYIDKNPKSQIVLLGSSSMSLLKGVSESLTGRAGFIEVSGVLVSEFKDSPEKLWSLGSYPSIHWRTPKIKPKIWYPDLLRSILERDIPQLGFKVSSYKLRGILTMVAQSQGSLLNLSELGVPWGLNHHEVGKILDIFEGIFLIRRLQPFSFNTGKRLVKSPKIYIRDSGILHYLLDAPFTYSEILLHPKVGASFESFCIEQIISSILSINVNIEFFFFRTQAGAECDLLVKFGKTIIPIEIKMNQVQPHLKSMKIVMEDLNLPKGFVVTLTKAPYPMGAGIQNISLTEMIQLLKKMISKF